MKKAVIGLLFFSLSWVGFAADDPDPMVTDAIASLEEGIELLKKGTLEAGAEEIRWGLELVDKALQSDVDTLFVDQVDLGASGVFSGGEISKNKMMGASITERVYRNKAGAQIKVTFTRTSAGSGGGLMAGLGGLAQLGFMQGERVRIGGVTGSAMDDGGEKSVILTLEDGSLFNVTSFDVGLDVVKAFTRAYPVRELNDTVSKK